MFRILLNVYIVRPNNKNKGPVKKLQNITTPRSTMILWCQESDVSATIRKSLFFSWSKQQVQTDIFYLTEINITAQRRGPDSINVILRTPYNKMMKCDGNDALPV